jgi:hypothetical protein
LFAQVHEESALVAKKCILHLVNCFCGPLYCALWAGDRRQCQVLVFLLLAVHLVSTCLVHYL